MKSLLITLLAASLAGNAALALYSYRQETKAVAAAAGVNLEAAAAASTASSPTTVASSGTPSAGTTAPTMAWKGARTDADLRNVVAGLRAAGYPPSILRAVVGQMLREREESANPEADRPYWKRGTRPTAEEAAAVVAKQKETQSLREELLGADGTPAAMLSASERARRFGGLSDDKVNALLKLDQEYSEVRTLAAAGSESTNGRDRMAQQRALEAEKRADLEAMLTPAELEAYDMRTSRTAQSVQNDLRGIDVTEAEYAQLYRAQKAAEAANPARGEFNGAEGFVNRIVGQAETNEQARAILGDERFFKYLESADQSYAAAARFAAQQPAMTQAQTYQLYQLQNEMMLSMASARGAQNGPPTAERMAEFRSMAETYNTRLQTLLGPEGAEAYKKQGNGRIFNAIGQGVRMRNANGGGGRN